MKEPLLAIVGPTATGKSEVALEVADALNGEIISADSAQVYRGLNIGSAKLPEALRVSANGKTIPHHLIDVAEPDAPYNIGLYQTAARKAAAEIAGRGKLPILCGGSGLYAYSLINSGYELSDARPDQEQRQQWLAEEQARGVGYLHGLLQQRFPRRAAAIAPRDYHRLLRALEQTGDLPAQPEANNWDSPYELTIFGLTLPRDVLYQRIETRVDRMFEQGLEAEVRGLVAAGCRPEDNSLQALGYKELLPLLRGDYDAAAAAELLKRNTRHFAKRQITWFKRDPRIVWLDMTDYVDAPAAAREIVKRFR